MEYLVVVEKGRSSYGAYVPDLPGCVAAGGTSREVLRLIRDAVKLHIDALRESGQSVPEPTSKGDVVRVRAA
jgi:predicted RNase H-like HicB family nuclease